MSQILPGNFSWSASDLDLLIILHAKVAWTRDQHDTHVLQRAFDDMHVLVQVAGWRLGGVRQEGILKVHTQSLGEVVVPKRQTALQHSKHTRMFIHSHLFILTNLSRASFLKPLTKTIFGWIYEVLTVLMLTLMTGMRERQDDVGSWLSALMFTLYGDHRTFGQFNSTTFPVNSIHLAVWENWQ